VDDHSRYSCWAYNPGLDWLQTVAQFAVVALAVVLAFIPASGIVLLLAVGGGLMAASQPTMTQWFSAYLIWFLPLVVTALLAAYETGKPSTVLNPVRRSERGSAAAEQLGETPEALPT
jgi:hypothetical protein